MALVPTFTAIVSTNKGDYVTLYDTTDDQASNPNSYGNPNSDITDITAASVVVTDVDGKEVLSQDLLSVYPTTADEFALITSLDWSKDDGYYKFTFSVTYGGASAGDYTYEYEMVYFGNAKNAEENLWLSAYPDETCKCSDQRILDAAMTASKLLYGIKAASTSNNLASITQMVAMSKKIIALSERYCF